MDPTGRHDPHRRLPGRDRATRLRPRPCRSSCPGGRVDAAQAGQLPAHIDDGDAVAERVHGAVEQAGRPGLDLGLDIVGPRNGGRVRRRAQGRLFDGRGGVHRLRRPRLPLAAERAARAGGRAQPRRRGLRDRGRDPGRRGPAADERAALCALDPAARAGRVGVVGRGVGRRDHRGRTRPSANGPGDAHGRGGGAAGGAHVAADRPGGEGGCVSDRAADGRRERAAEDRGRRPTGAAGLGRPDRPGIVGRFGRDAEPGDRRALGRRQGGDGIRGGTRRRPGIRAPDPRLGNRSAGCG